jgi:general secretion pathway protein E
MPHTGYRGRAGLYELMVLTDRRALRAPGARPCPAAAPPGRQGRHAPAAPGRCMKVAEGVTTLEEVLRSTPSLDVRG